MIIAVVIIGVILFSLLTPLELIWLNGHFKQKKAKTFFDQVSSHHKYLGLGGTGYMVIEASQIVIFKGPHKLKKIPLNKLQAFIRGKRIDFGLKNQKLSVQDRIYGLVFNDEEKNKVVEDLNSHRIEIKDEEKNDLYSYSNN